MRLNQHDLTHLGCFNGTIILLSLVGYEIIIRASLGSYSYLTRARVEKLFIVTSRTNLNIHDARENLSFSSFFLC